MALPMKFYIGNYGGPLTTDVFAADEETPVLPESASIDIFNMDTGEQVVSDGVCSVASGLATYAIPEGATYMDVPGRYVGYMDVVLDSSTKLTNEVYFNVFDKASTLVLSRWRAKVEDSALSPDHIDDDDAREWVDQAVAEINRRYTSGYTSVLGTISPTPTDSDLEFIASTASLLARTAWYAAKGTWRDDEMSYDARAIQAEWTAFETYFQELQTSGIYDAIEPRAVRMKNLDNVFFRGLYFDPMRYYRLNKIPLDWGWPGQ